MLRNLTRTINRNTRSYAKGLDLNFIKLNNSAKHQKKSHLPPLVIIHGLFGTLNNFSTFARSYEQDVYMLDMRNHGSSPHDTSMSFEDMADDLELFLEKNDLHLVDLLGFSLGGKLSMTCAIRNPPKMQKIIRRLVVGDISPTAIPNPSAWDIPDTLKSLMKVDATISSLESRSQADDILKNASVNDPNVRSFLLSNLNRVANQPPNMFKWKFNLHALNQQVDVMASFPYYPPGMEKTGDNQNSNRFENPTLFLKGQLSNLIPSHSKNVIDYFFPDNELVEFLQCGHWIHTQNPKMFHDEIVNFLNKE
ncbi:abhd11 [Acrasis kona]|uniref:Abhd11 n=1 Tax=Acrasis kona TaxID=1008807 RepID=A0AAW2ZL84_9EUKA